MLYTLPSFEYFDPLSIEEAVNLLDQHQERARVIAGGTDLLVLMKRKIKGPKMMLPEILVNVKGIGLNDITYDNERGLTIRAATPLHDIENSHLVREKFKILAQAAGEVATPQIRSVGTIGGNLCQRPRCSYFRHPYYICLKKGGSKCFAITGQNKYYYSILKIGVCVMAHPSDIAPALLALDGSVSIVGPKGSKVVKMEDFFLEPSSAMENVLQPNELLTDIYVPNMSENSRGIFLKKGLRRTSDFALASVAMVIQRSGKLCEEARIVLGGVAPYPYRVHKAEELVQQRIINDDLATEVAKEAVRGAHPLRMNGYKSNLVKSLVKKAMKLMGEEASSGGRND